MSHTTTLRGVAIRDIAALTQTIAELKAQGVDIELHDYKQTQVLPRMYSQGQARDLVGQGLEYTIKLNKSQYDIGLCRQADGSLAPAFDTWNGYIENQLGADRKNCPLPQNEEERRTFDAQRAIGKLMQTYAKNAAINAAVLQGYSVESAYVDGDGNAQLVINTDQGGF